MDTSGSIATRPSSRSPARTDHGRSVSFKDRSRRPHRSPTAISSAVEAAIVDLRKQRPHRAKKLRIVLGKQCSELTLPSESTFAAVLKRNGLVRPRKRQTKSTVHGTAGARTACERRLGDRLQGRLRDRSGALLSSHDHRLLQSLHHRLRGADERCDERRQTGDAACLRRVRAPRSDPQ